MIKLETLKLYKYYSLDIDTIVETDLSCIDIDEVYIYMSTTPTTPANINFQIYKNDELLYEDWSMGAVCYMNNPDYAVSELVRVIERENHKISYTTEEFINWIQTNDRWDSDTLMTMAFVEIEEEFFKDKSKSKCQL